MIHQEGKENLQKTLCIKITNIRALENSSSLENIDLANHKTILRKSSNASSITVDENVMLDKEKINKMISKTIPNDVNCIE